MCIVVGSENCARCNAVKSVLGNNSIPFTYMDFRKDLSPETQDGYMSQARNKGLMSFPIIIKEGSVVSLQEVLM